MPAATAAADPPLDPPGTSSVSQGFAQPPCTDACVSEPMPNSSRLVLPATIAPARCRRRTQVALNGATWVPSSADPQLRGWPATAMLSLTAQGIPAIGPEGAPSAPSAASANDTKALIRSFHPRA